MIPCAYIQHLLPILRPLSVTLGCEHLSIVQHDRTPGQGHRLLERYVGRDLWWSVVQPPAQTESYGRH